MSLDDKLNKATFAWQDELFCLNGPLNKQRDKLMQKLAEAVRTQEANKQGGDQRLNVNPVKIIQDEIEALEEQMREDSITIRFTAVNNGVWQKWILQHPPRKGNDLDRSLGYNAERFFWTAATLSSHYVSEPGTEEAKFEDATLDTITDSQWKKIDESLTAGDWDRIDMVLIGLNQKDGQRGADFLRRGSRTTTSSEPTSDSLVTSE